jgi:hypothetical protein
MRSSIASIFVLPIAALQIPSIFAPFYEPRLEPLISNDTLIPDEHELLKRDGNCPANFNSCTTLAAGYGGACCTSGSICTTDRAHNIASVNVLVGWKLPLTELADAVPLAQLVQERLACKQLQQLEQFLERALGRRRRRRLQIPLRR